MQSLTRSFKRKAQFQMTISISATGSSELGAEARWSSAVFAAYFVLLQTALLILFSHPTFEERGNERVFLAVLLLATVIAIWFGRAGAEGLLQLILVPVRRFGFAAVAGLSLILLPILLLVAKLILDCFPNSGDEIAYVMQAQTYAEGRLWVHVPLVPEAFRQFRFFDMGGKWVSQYTPGWPALMASALAGGLPGWIVNPVLGSALLPAFFVLARRFVTAETAWLGVMLLGLSPFFILNGGSFFPHFLTALLALLFALAAQRYLNRGEVWSILASGVCIGLMGLTRPQNAAIFVAPFAVALAFRSDRRKGLLWLGCAGLPFLLILLAYNQTIHGNPFLASMNGRGVAGAGGTVPFELPDVHALQMTWRNIIRLYSWTSPVLVIGAAVAFARLLWRRETGITDWIMPITVGVFVLYNDDGGFQYGPRYYFEAWPFALLTILKAIDPFITKPSQSRIAAAICSAIIVSLACELAFLPVRLDREHKVIVERKDVYRQVKHAGLADAIVFIASDVGDIRPMSPVDLVRNGLHVGDSSVMYALDRGAQKDAEVMKVYGGRSPYIYKDGRLEKLEP